MNRKADKGRRKEKRDKKKAERDDKKKKKGDDKDDKDKRSDKEQKQAAEKGLQMGASIFMLTSKVGKHSKTQKIKRKPTKADKESHVNNADRALHKRLAAEVKAKLEAKGKSTKGVETFEAFYEILKKEALVLQKEYQPKLRNGIKTVVDLGKCKQILKSTVKIKIISSLSIQYFF